jgi:5-methylcytosine-specific restriction endonuclease McrA
MAEPTFSRPGDRTRWLNARARNERICKQCGTAFWIKSLSGKARAGLVHEGQYCSVACRGMAVRKYPDRKAARRAGKARRKLQQSRPCPSCGTPYAKVCRSIPCREGTRLHRAVIARMLRERHFACRGCSTWVTGSIGQQRYCTAECQLRHSKLQYRANRRNAKHLGVSTIDPLVVFERDAWRCRHCGCKTFKGKRGTCHPRAPEIDHLVPISRGGANSYDNVACSCRRCNRTKRNRSAGQLILPFEIADDGKGG